MMMRFMTKKNASNGKDGSEHDSCEHRRGSYFFYGMSETSVASATPADEGEAAASSASSSVVVVEAVSLLASSLPNRLVRPSSSSSSSLSSQGRRSSSSSPPQDEDGDNNVDFLEDGTHSSPATPEDRKETTAKAAPASSCCSCFRSGSADYFDRDALILSARVATGMTLASLLILCFPPEQPPPSSSSSDQPTQNGVQSVYLPAQYAVWAVRTVGVVLWFPELDLASSLKRAWERLLGTAIGGGLGLAFGFLSLPIPTPTGQGVFIAVWMGASLSLAAYFSNLLQYRKDYTVVIGSITCALAFASFYSPTSTTAPSSGWRAGAFRILMILVGCMIGALVAAVVWPRPSWKLVQAKIEGLVGSAGKSARLVVEHSFAAFEGKRVPAPFEDIVRCKSRKGPSAGDDNKNIDDDAAYQSYIHCMDSWKVFQSSFADLRYDLSYRLRFSAAERDEFQRRESLMLARSFRLHTNVIALDMLVRTISSAEGICEFVKGRVTRHLEIVQDVGRRIELVLDLSADAQEREVACSELQETDLGNIRCIVADLAQEFLYVDVIQSGLSTPPKEGEYDGGGKDEEGCPPLISLETKEKMPLFFQLLEFLVVRTILFHSYRGREITSVHDDIDGDDGIQGKAPNNSVGKRSGRGDAENSLDSRLSSQQSEPSQAAVEGEADAQETQVQPCLWKQCIDMWLVFDRESFVFASRVGTSTLLATLIGLLVPPDDVVLDGFFVIINAVVVAWVPANDTATVVKKALERTLGTFIGAVGGLAFGFLSLLPGNGTPGQAAIIGASIAVIGFLYVFVACVMGYRSNYAAILSATTFSLVILAFYNDDDGRPWRYGVMRSVSILVGALLAALVSLLLWPSSTKRALESKVAEQLSVTAKSAQLVLEKAYEALLRMRKPRHITDVIHISDEAYESCVNCTSKWKACKSMFPMLAYDPPYLLLSPEDRRRFRDDMASRLTRAFRIHVNVTMTDAVIRMGVPPPCGGSAAADSLADLLEDVRELVRQAAAASAGEPPSNAGDASLSAHLIRIRRHLIFLLLSDRYASRPSRDPRVSTSSSSSSSEMRAQK